jgi:hypothetical protein
MEIYLSFFRVPTLASPSTNEDALCTSHTAVKQKAYIPTQYSIHALQSLR